MEINYNDTRYYRHCQMKAHTMWLCKPPVGTIVIDKLKRPDVVRAVGGRTYFTAVEVETMRVRNPNMYAVLSQFVNQFQARRVGPYDAVICGTRGELMLTNLEQAKRQYLIQHKGRWSDGWTVALWDRAVSYGNEDCFRWTKIHSCGSSDLCACFIPVAQVGQVRTPYGYETINAPGVDHGLGDFLVCPYDSMGNPYFGCKQVVNGLVFGDTFNNRNWAGQLRQTGECGDPPEPAPLFVVSK